MYIVRRANKVIVLVEFVLVLVLGGPGAEKAQNEPPGASFGMFAGMGPKRLKMSLLGSVLACSRAWARKGSK